MGALYQLWGGKHVVHPPGTAVAVNGPYDHYGYIIKKIRTEEDGRPLYLIRGTGNTNRASTKHIPQF